MSPEEERLVEHGRLCFNGAIDSVVSDLRAQAARVRRSGWDAAELRAVELENAAEKYEHWKELRDCLACRDSRPEKCLRHVRGPR